VELGTALKAVRSWWLIVALTTVIGGAVAVTLTMSRPPSYTATAEGLVSIKNPQNRPPYSLSVGSQYILDRMTSYADIGETTPVLQPVVDGLNLNETAVTLRRRVSSHSQLNRAVLDVSVTDSDPAAAARIADASLYQLEIAIERIEQGKVDVRSVGRAAVPSAPSNHNVVRNGAVGVAAGIVVGFFVAVGLGALSDRNGVRALLHTRWFRTRR
jgi:capsular polysaccharide biosynthesis protein